MVLYWHIVRKKNSRLVFTVLLFSLIGIISLSVSLQESVAQQLDIPQGGGWVSLKGTGTTTDGYWKFTLKQDGYFVYGIDSAPWTMNSGKGTGTVSITATNVNSFTTCSTSGTFTTSFDVDGWITDDNMLYFYPVNISPSEFSLPKASCSTSGFPVKCYDCYETALNPFRFGQGISVSNVEGNTVSKQDAYSSNGNANWNISIEKVVDPRKQSSSSTGNTGSTTSSDIGPFRFKVSVSEFAELHQGNILNVPITVKKISGTPENVKLTVTNWNSVGLDTSFTQRSIVRPDLSASSTIKIVSSCNTKPGDYLFTITGNPEGVGGESSQDAISIRVLSDEYCSNEKKYDCEDYTTSLDESISCLENLLDGSKNDVDVMTDIGLYQWLQGNYNESLSTYEKVIQLNVSDESVDGALLNLSIMCRDMNDKRVPEACDLIIKYDSNSELAIQEKDCEKIGGTMNWGDGNCYVTSTPSTAPNSSINDEKVIIDTDSQIKTPSQIGKSVNTALEYCNISQNLDLKIACLQTANKELPNEPQILNQLAMEYANVGDFKSTISTLESLYAIQQEPAILLGLAELAASEGKSDDAVNFLLLMLTNHSYESDAVSAAKNSLQVLCKNGTSSACDIYKKYEHCTPLSPCEPSSSKSLQEDSVNPKLTSLQQKEKVPSWIKNNAKWWAEGAIDDQTFVGGLQHLIKENVIAVPRQTVTSSAISNEIPAWVKTQTEWWANGQISEEEYISSIEYLMKQGIINLDDTKLTVSPEAFSMKTDKISYEVGEIMIVSGNVEQVIDDPLYIKVHREGLPDYYIEADKFTRPKADGSFTVEIDISYLEVGNFDVTVEYDSKIIQTFIEIK
ncbi:MAG: tetratricopeptide repeat protein [Nitrosopumilus sp.]|nr:tetratricopeptide repeat protein [Nitrosopumilus sp.]